MPEFKKVFDDWNALVKGRGWITYSLDNHDFPRMVSRFGNDQEYRKASAKQLIAIVASQPGTPCFYFGTEIGMTNIEMQRVEDFDDVEIKNAWKEWKAAGKDEQEFIRLNNKMGRDNVRTPFQWDDSEFAGFSEGKPWIKVNPRNKEINLAESEADPDSILNFFRAFLAKRRTHKTWIYGDYKPLTPDHESLYVYERFDDEHRYLFVHQMANDPIEYVLPEGWEDAQAIFGNYDIAMPNVDSKIALRPWETRIFSAPKD
jgi:oligo-1,6-glucosidase